MTEDITKARKKGGRRRSKDTYNITLCPDGSHDFGTPQHAAAVGHQQEMMRSDCDKNAVGNPFSPAVVPASRESSRPLPGHAADSVANGGNSPGPREMAYRHPDMRNGSDRITPFVRMQPDQNVGYLAAGALSRAVRNGMPLQVQEPGEYGPVSVMRLDTTNDHGAEYPTSGQMDNLRNPPSGNPSNREAPHSVPCTSNGSHSVSGNVCSTAVSGGNNYESGRAVSNAALRESVKSAMRDQGVFG